MNKIDVPVDLEKELDPELQYFDATPTIEQLARMYGDLRTRLQAAEAALELQARINAGIISNLRQLLPTAAENDTKPTGLILPKRLDS